MADALGIGALKQEYRDVLQGECNRFMALVASWNLASRPGQVREKLEEIHTDVGRLLKTLHALHETEVPDRTARQAALALLHSAVPGAAWNDLDNDLLAFTERLAEIGKAASIALHELPGGGGGPPGDLPLEELANGLADLFTEITKNNPSITSDPHAELEEEYRGKFLDFVEAFLKPLTPHYRKRRRDLGVALKRILRARKRS